MERDTAAALFWAAASERFIVRGKLTLQDNFLRRSFGRLSACNAPLDTELLPKDWQSLDAAEFERLDRQISDLALQGYLIEVDAYRNPQIVEQISEARLTDVCALYQVTKSVVPIEISSTEIIGRVSVLDIVRASK